MKRLTALAFLALAACGREEPPAPPTPIALSGRIAPPADDREERSSLTNIARGATIISRTGESFLEKSAASVIDGDPETYWHNPPRDLPQTIVIGLAARTRIERVGLRTTKQAYTANGVQFETSLDGAAWRPLATIDAAASKEAQWLDVAPAEASFLRVTALPGKQADVWLDSILADGSELEPPRAGDAGGCWALNGRLTTFAQRGARVLGAQQIGALPMFLDGGGDGRALRFVWIRGNDYGLALTTVSPDGKHLTALSWHEEAIPLFQSEPWFGERVGAPALGRASTPPARSARPGAGAPTPCGSLKPREDVVLGLLRRVGRYSAFGLRFRSDDTLDLEASRDTLSMLSRLLPELRVEARFVVHEFREATPEQNKAKAQRELEAVRAALGPSAARVTFVAAGSDAPRQQPATEPMRALYSSVDLEIRR